MENNFIVGVVHFLFSILIASYAFITQKNWGDFIYIFYTFFVLISWTSCNGECLVTFLSKRSTDIHYIPGKDVHNNEDMYIFPISNESVNMILNILMSLWWYGIYKVLHRNKYPDFIAFSFIITWIFYKFLLLTYTNHDSNNEFHNYQKIALSIFIILLISVIYYTKNILFTPLKN